MTSADLSGFLAKTAAEAPENLLKMAQRETPSRVVIAQGASPAALMAARVAFKSGVATPLFTGDRAQIESIAQSQDWSVADFDVIAAEGESDAARAAFVAVNEGRADAVMKGQLHTDVLMKAAFNRETGIRTGRRFVHVFYLTPPGSDRALMVSDAAVNVAPDLETRKESLRSMAMIARATGVERPKLAILSATETPIPSVPSSMEAAELKAWAATDLPEADVGGPYALDGVLSAEAAQIKGLGSDPVAGGVADGVLAPGVDAGNALFKALVYLSGACSAGVVLGGAVPVLLTSRADSPASRLASIALASVLASTMEQSA